MKPVAREWIAKAEADFLSAQREFRARKHPNYDAACFFAQQCVEKYLKGRMADAGMVVPRTHDLAALLDALLPLEPLREAAPFPARGTRASAIFKVLALARAA